MGLLDNVIRTLCPTAGYVQDYVKNNPEQAKKIVKTAGTAAKKTAKTLGKAALYTTAPGLLYSAGKAAAQHPKETKAVFGSLAEVGLFGLPGKLLSAIG